jgi:uncharacterized damage-inducible protein DinB
MVDLKTLRRMLEYNDWADGRLLECARPLDATQLDQRFDIGPGSLRRTLLHIHAGEDVWVKRCSGKVETPWPPEDRKMEVPAIEGEFRRTWAERDAFLKTITSESTSRLQTYRDSKGSLFKAALGDMLLQLCYHATHHRAQAVNILRRLGTQAPELDYMMRIREPA